MKSLMLIALVVLLACYCCCQQGFFVSASRFSLLNFANITVKVNESISLGPGSALITDPLNSNKLRFLGKTINRQTFIRQFAADIGHALNISASRVVVRNIMRGTTSFSWVDTSVIVNFLLLESGNSNNSSDTLSSHIPQPSLVQVIPALTAQIQNPNSFLRQHTNVTLDIDPYFGLQIQHWDSSLRLYYAVAVVGGIAVQNDNFINLGSLGACDNATLAVEFGQYCEFERFFENDIAVAANVTSDRVAILFVKLASLDSVYVQFRIFPPTAANETSTDVAMNTLASAVHNSSSLLYAGNVTVRTDSTWGLGGVYPMVRREGPLFSYRHFIYDNERLRSNPTGSQLSTYDRCKSNRRCNAGVIDYNVSTNSANYFQQLFFNGKLYPVDLFVNFDDWKQGHLGFQVNQSHFKQNSNNNINSSSINNIPGSHFLPDEHASIVLTRFNETFAKRFANFTNGTYFELLNRTTTELIVDRVLQQQRIEKLRHSRADLLNEIEWITANKELLRMDAVRRSRYDVSKFSDSWLERKRLELQFLNDLLVDESYSSCTKDNASCSLLFNTSSLEITGLFSGRGALQRTTEGTEIAVFCFDSIYLGPEVNVTVVGQRAMAILSRSSLVINTTIDVKPGTVGGFIGGGSIGRIPSEKYVDHPSNVYLCEFTGSCDRSFSRVVNASEMELVLNNNVNGPGSGNVLVTSFVMQTSITERQEVQQIRTTAAPGQTLSGSFVLKYRSFTTPAIPATVSATELRRIIDVNLNYLSSESLNMPINRNQSWDRVGVGSVWVTRSRVDGQGGFSWNVTFLSATSDVDLLVVSSNLISVGANASVVRMQAGNNVGGHFDLKLSYFQQQHLLQIQHNESSQQLKQKLIALPFVVDCHVVRTKEDFTCMDGLCKDGRGFGGVFTWSLVVSTITDFSTTMITSPLFPTAINHSLVNLDLNVNGLMLSGNEVKVSLYLGTTLSPDNLFSALLINQSFHLAYGGGGGSYGGIGGSGYLPTIPLGVIYNNDNMHDLLGGSGGCMRGENPLEINSVSGRPSGLGGAGGAAIEFVANNDIVLGTEFVLDVSGSDGEQSTHGGGGGGSGGGVVVAGGGNVQVNGFIYARGGSGGASGVAMDDVRLVGGGGGGGRIAIFGESVQVRGVLDVKGGYCGSIPKQVILPSLNAHVIVQMNSSLLLNRDATVALLKKMIDTKLTTLQTNVLHIETAAGNENPLDVYVAVISLNVSVPIHNGSVVQSIAVLESELQSIINVNETFAGFAIEQATILDYNISTFMKYEYTPRCSSNQTGGNGTIVTESLSGSVVTLVHPGAQETPNALFVSTRHNTNFSKPFLLTSTFATAQPSKISFYLQINNHDRPYVNPTFGVLFYLHNSNAIADSKTPLCLFVGEKIFHGTDVLIQGNASSVLNGNIVQLPSTVTFNTWTKVDITINWKQSLYNVAINDTVFHVPQSFNASLGFDHLSMLPSNDVALTVDEIFVGFDATHEFSCPVNTRTKVESSINSASSSTDTETDTDTDIKTKLMSRHYNFLPLQLNVAFDGDGLIKTRNEQYAATAANARLGFEKTVIPLSQLVQQHGSKKYFLYQHYTYPSCASNSSKYGNYCDDLGVDGITSCSTIDGVTWSFEGILFQSVNLTDTVYNTPAPFHVRRPSILYNNQTQQYVLWMNMENTNSSLGALAIATSPFSDGPYLFSRAMYPDGNFTTDQSLLFDRSLNTYSLARTYPYTIEYVQPTAIAQPVWESVKHNNGSVNFRTNYHRAYYAVEYDNYHDIYLQRWRLEDKPARVQCINKLTGAIRYTPPNCIDPAETKNVIGQGNPVVTSRYVSPADPSNSWWMPTSQSSVKAQPWSFNYVDGLCGIHLLDEGYNSSDPNLANFKPIDRSNCSNIADNPPHISAQDVLLGPLYVASTRRAQFVAISALTDDFMDTTGAMSTFEGKVDQTSGISSILGSISKRLGMVVANTTRVQSTYIPPLALNDAKIHVDGSNEIEILFHQYVSTYGDRAQYSLACVVDGNCPVNFEQQIIT